MTTTLTESANFQLDQMLADICIALQITPTQYRKAEKHYLAVGDWLAAPGSPIEKLNPRIYPQGSVALGTTVRPWTDADEYDLDLVLEMDTASDNPMALYRLVADRLKANGTYARMLELKRRCLCLNYEEDGGVFHMDILPARHDGIRGDTCIEIPDRNTPEEWQPSNPLGYKAWFDRQARMGVLLERAEQAPLPGHEPAEDKTVLQLMVQLLKRRRDLVFAAEPEDAPRSVVLTTLAGRHYDGSRDLVTALYTVLTRIEDQIRRAHPRRIIVCNPTNADELFCESFKTDALYRTFVDFIAQFRLEVEVLLRTNGIPQLQRELSKLFGDMPARVAIREYTERMSKARDTGGVFQSVSRSTPAGLVVPALGAPRPNNSQRAPVAPNTFFGE
jgi:hypothetical protein